MAGGNGNLNLRQRRFVDEYLVDGNGKEAAIRAGYSERSVKDQVKNLMHNPRIKAAIEVKQFRLSRKTEITAEKVIKRLWEEGNFFGKGASHGARVTALTNLAKLIGADPTAGQEGFPSTIQVVLVKPGENGDGR